MLYNTGFCVSATLQLVPVVIETCSIALCDAAFVLETAAKDRLRLAAMAGVVEHI